MHWLVTCLMCPLWHTDPCWSVPKGSPVRLCFPLLLKPVLAVPSLRSAHSGGWTPTPLPYPLPSHQLLEASHSTQPCIIVIPLQFSFPFWSLVDHYITCPETLFHHRAANSLGSDWPNIFDIMSEDIIRMLTGADWLAGLPVVLWDPSFNSSLFLQFSCC